MQQNRDDVDELDRAEEDYDFEDREIIDIEDPGRLTKGKGLVGSVNGIIYFKQ
jgi:hypothetical protein